MEHYAIVIPAVHRTLVDTYSQEWGTGGTPIAGWCSAA
jgi:hypothetical protein